MFDLIISGGEVIDGTGNPRVRGDVGVRGDRVEAVGDLREVEAKTRIDAAGKIVAPGFIDVHNHDDGWMLRGRHLTCKTTQGFTSEVLMADGISYAPVNEFTAAEWLYYLRPLNALRLDEYRGWQSWEDYMRLVGEACVQNSAGHLPYANIRSLVCGFRRAAADDFEMRQIKHEIRKGMEAGAVGLSTGLDYIVQCFSSTDEIAEACTVVGEYGGLYVTHVRYKAGLLTAIKEAVEIGRRSGAKVHISHLKAPSGETREQVLEYIDKTARHEVDFSFEVYPYQPGSTTLAYLMPYEIWEDGPLAALGRLGRPESRRRMAEGLAAFRLNLDRIHIAWTAGKADSVHQGKSLAAYIKETGLSIEDAVFNLLAEEGFAVLLVLDEGDDELVEPFVAHDLGMIGTDGIFHEAGVVHPRVYGSSGRVLGPMVRDKKLFSLETAVHKLSGQPASRFGLADRGILRAGTFADLVVFDPLTVTDRATFTHPHQTCLGIEQVFVNGTPIVRDGEPLEGSGEAPGRFLKFSKD